MFNNKRVKEVLEERAKNVTEENCVPVAQKGDSRETIRLNLIRLHYQARQLHNFDVSNHPYVTLSNLRALIRDNKNIDIFKDTEESMIATISHIEEIFYTELGIVCVTDVYFEINEKDEKSLKIIISAPNDSGREHFYKKAVLASENNEFYKAVLAKMHEKTGIDFNIFSLKSVEDNVDVISDDELTIVAKII